MNIYKDYREVFGYIYNVTTNNDEDALLKLIDILRPMVMKYSKNPVTNSFDDELYDILTLKLYESIKKFEIKQ